MAQVPPEAVEFARMLTRAFYPIEYAVVVDGVLRKNNFCSHADLSFSLRMQPKELRQVLTRMVTSRLMCNDKLKQRRINYKDDKRPSRIVQTEFWYVPLQDMIDAFQFRVDKISRELDEKIRKEREQDLYQCLSCGKRYKLVDIVGNVDEEGNFYCDAITDTRRDCGGLIKEEDNSSRLKETENFKKRFEEELQPLRALAVRCVGVSIPNHPLEGADKETWDLYVPETIGLRGEVVDAEGLNSELAAEVNGPQADTAIVDFQSNAGGSLGGEATVIPDRPDWFKDGSKGDDDDDDDWEDNENMAASGSGPGVGPTFGTGAMLGAENEADAKSYVDSYMKVLAGDGGVPESDDAVAKPEKDGGEGAGADPDASQAPTGVGSERAGKEGDDAEDMAAAKPDGTDTQDVAAEAAEEADPALDVSVTVKGEVYKLRDVTQDLVEQMTQEEFQQYCEVRPMGDDDDDDDIEFE